MAQLVSSLLQDLLKKYGESLSTEFGFMFGIEQKREKLYQLLLALNEVVTDAEEQGYKKAAVESWIAQLKLAACDADDVIDEVHYEVLRTEAFRAGHKVNSGARGFFSPLYNPIILKYRIGKRLQQILERLGDLVLHMNQFGFIRDWSMPMGERMQTHSYVDEQDVIGREGDRKKIVCTLLGARSEKLPVFSIVGIGGLGKTTLAQLILSDAEIRNGFQKLLWVCVSQEFSIVDVVKQIIVSAAGIDHKLSDNMELLQRRLRKELRRNYLLVLDDVWNDDVEKWDALRTLLASGEEGSVILVTTRNMHVASIMGTVETFHLEKLSPEESWSLFSRRAFGAGRVGSPELVSVGKKIVSKCYGVPLAVKSVAALMSSNQDPRYWLNILENNSWNEENKILPALMVSYKHLPSHMKPCFAFCAAFPKDYEIDKNDLIHLWISNGFIPPTTSDLEAAGNHIFSQLVWRSFFQDVKTGWSWGKENYGYHDMTTFKMHDLMHDLAVDISGNECFCLQKYSQIREIQQDVHHLTTLHSRKMGFVVQNCSTIRSLFSLDKYNISFGQNLNITNSTLRVLGIHFDSIEAFSIEPAFMKHLRYLDFSCSSIKAIPEVTSALYNLQVLMLNNCSCLNQLPEGMKYMVNLRHVYLDGCHDLKCMPAGLGQLSSLRTLTRYIVGNHPGQGISELRNLKLGGKLHIYNLMKVNNPFDAKEAGLERKKDIEQLMFCWTASKYTGSELCAADVSEEVLEALKPHHSLKVLKIQSYPGTRFPSWMTDSIIVQNLIELTLIGCVNCTTILSAWQFPCLEVLQIKEMTNLEYLCRSYSVGGGCSNSQVLFPKLRFLSIKKLKTLKSFDAREASSLILPSLDAMKISDCPLLTALPEVPVLKSLIVKRNKKLLDLAAGLSSLSFLSLTASHESCSVLNNLPENHDTTENIWGSVTYLCLNGFNCLLPDAKEHRSDQLAKVVDLSLTSCDCFIQSDPQQSPLWFWKLFADLEKLCISNCDSLTFWPEKEFQSLSSLKELVIELCENFTGLSTDLPSVNPSANEGPRNLEVLEILSCPNLVAFPTCFTCLKGLIILGSSKIESVPAGGFDCVGSLESLEVSQCPSLKFLPDMRCLSHLRRLEFSYCNSLSQLPDGMHHLTALKSLVIAKCPRIEALPDGLQQRLTTLERFIIDECPALARKCKCGGDYWDRVKEIPDLDVTETSEQCSAWQQTASVLNALCTNAWYRIIFCGQQPGS